MFRSDVVPPPSTLYPSTIGVTIETAFPHDWKKLSSENKDQFLSRFHATFAARAEGRRENVFNPSWVTKSPEHGFWWTFRTENTVKVTLPFAKLYKIYLLREEISKFVDDAWKEVAGSDDRYHKLSLHKSVPRVILVVPHGLFGAVVPTSTTAKTKLVKKVITSTLKERVKDLKEIKEEIKTQVVSVLPSAGTVTAVVIVGAITVTVVGVVVLVSQIRG